MTKFHKLVRNRIPEIISENGEIPHFRVIEDD
jgi:predicted house-cleaning noncanonical NTP pyrophosphatase (MazG superfamily)